jgi:hypothetical protein
MRVAQHPRLHEGADGKHVHAEPADVVQRAPDHTAHTLACKRRIDLGVGETASSSVFW